MPNRIARDSARSSRKLASVSAEVERLFWRLILVADDFGRFDADPAVVLSTAFPRQSQTIKIKSVASWLQVGARVGLWLLYQYGDDVIGQMSKWEQRVRANKSKFPPSDDGQVTVIRQTSACPYEEHGSRGKDEEHGSRAVTPSVTGDNNGFDRFWKAYPKKREKPEALAEWRGTASVRPSDDELLLRLEQHKKSLEWTEKGGKYIPWPAKWLKKQRWLDDLTEVHNPDLLPDPWEGKDV